MRSHHGLRVWQDSMALVTRLYSVTRTFPADERFGLTAQIRRAAISVPSNIAEGAARLSRKEFLHFLGIARGSLSELDTQIRLAMALGFTPDTEDLLEEIERLQVSMSALIQAQRKKLAVDDSSPFTGGAAADLPGRRPT